jgi:hypothetical protein
VRDLQHGRRDPLAWILAALCALHLSLTPRLLAGDLNLDYPFMDGDSWDWIANGLRLAGAQVRFSARPPLLPAAIALLDRLSALPWLPVLLQVLFLGTILSFYRLAARLDPRLDPWFEPRFAPIAGARRAAFATALALLLCHALRGMSLQIMADVPASCLLFWAVRSFLLAAIEDRPRRYLASGLWGAASALAQPAALLALLPAGATVLARRRQDLRSVWLGMGGAAFLGAPLLALWTERRLAAPGDPVLLHARLLHLHADSLPFYLWSLASLLGIPGALLLAAGLGLAVRRGPKDPVRLFLVLLVGVLLAFFLFFYDFNAERFLVYLIWPAALLISDLLSRLRRAPFLAAAALLVTGAALPLPSLGNDPSWIGLWPLPPVYAHADLSGDAAGSPRLDPAGISIRSFSAAELARFSTDTARDRGALFLAADPSDGGGRYRILTRLGNALRRRVKFVPADWLLPSLPRLAVTSLGSRAIGADYAVFRARLPGVPGTWLLVTSGDSPVRKRLEEAARSVPGPFSPDLRDGLANAKEIRRLISGNVGDGGDIGDEGSEGDVGYVALVSGPAGDPLRFYLPFLLDTSELYVIEPADEPEVRALARTAPLLGEDRAGGMVVRRILYLGRRAAVVMPEDGRNVAIHR